MYGLIFAAIIGQTQGNTLPPSATPQAFLYGQYQLAPYLRDGYYYPGQRTPNHDGYHGAGWGYGPGYHSFGLHRNPY
jgi:hypothetical protein